MRKTCVSPKRIYRCSDGWQYRRSLDLVKNGKINLADMVTAEFDKKDAIRASEKLKNCGGLENIIRF